MGRRRSRRFPALVRVTQDARLCLISVCKMEHSLLDTYVAADNSSAATSFGVVSRWLLQKSLHFPGKPILPTHHLGNTRGRKSPQQHARFMYVSADSPGNRELNQQYERLVILTHSPLCLIISSVCVSFISFSNFQMCHTNKQKSRSHPPI